MKYLSSLLVALTLSAAAQAQTLYVTDSFRAPLRTGNTNGYRIIAELKSGTAVDVLEEDSASGYTHVRTKKGTEGWILSRYLITEPIAKVRLEQAEAQLRAIQDQRKALKGSQSELEDALSGAQEDNLALKEINQKLMEELTYIKQVSGNTVSINERNKELVENNQQLQNQIELLNAEVTRLEDDTQKDYFIYGASAILIGIILGLILPSVRRKRKDPGWV